MVYFLAVLLTVEQAYDFITTYLIIKKGRGHEANPLIKWYMDLTGSYWWTIKIPFVAWIWYVALYSSPDLVVPIFAVIAALYCWVVYHNYRVLWRLA